MVALSLDVNIAIVRVDVRWATAGASCPLCGTWSNRVHGSYLRFPADVPSGGRSVVLRLRVRRFICPNVSCGRCTFVEQIPGLTRRHGQRTQRLRPAVADIGLALAGRAGARMGRQEVRRPARDPLRPVAQAQQERAAPPPELVRPARSLPRPTPPRRRGHHPRCRVTRGRPGTTPTLIHEEPHPGPRRRRSKTPGTRTAARYSGHGGRRRPRSEHDRNSTTSERRRQPRGLTCP
ncbi:transposase family protein [Streptomyces sp. NPDC051217]|uniref:transposase family protein n=1 Tax=Streptomyces sp. NPDC051217 TaxID=3365644 RepID=UPI0037BB5894